MRDPFTGEEIPEAPAAPSAPPTERAVSVVVTSVQDGRSQVRFIAEAALGAEHPVAVGETPGDALAALGRQMDLMLANHAWDVLVPAAAEEP